MYRYLIVVAAFLQVNPILAANPEQAPVTTILKFVLPNDKTEYSLRLDLPDSTSFNCTGPGCSSNSSMTSIAIPISQTIVDSLGNTFGFSGNPDTLGNYTITVNSTPVTTCSGTVLVLSKGNGYTAHATDTESTWYKILDTSSSSGCESVSSLP